MLRKVAGPAVSVKAAREARRDGDWRMIMAIRAEESRDDARDFQDGHGLIFCGSDLARRCLARQPLGRAKRQAEMLGEACQGMALRRVVERT